MAEDRTMYLLDTHIEMIRKDLSENPLVAGEIRRVEGAGGLYMALRETQVSVAEYGRLYNMSIDDISLSFYRFFGAVDQGVEVSV
jgi:hypothetical protein